MKMPRSRMIAFGIVAALLALFFVYAFTPRAISVDMAVVVSGDVLVTVNEEARTRVHDRFTVSAPVNGRLLRVEVEPGDDVIGGETVLARFVPMVSDPLDPRTELQASAAVEAAEAALDLAKAESEGVGVDLRLAQQTYDRYANLRAEDTISQADFDRVDRDLRVTRARLRSARASVNMRQADLTRAKVLLTDAQSTQSHSSTSHPYTTPKIPVLAPDSGKVLRIIHESETALPSGTPILEIGDPAGDLEVEVELLSTEAVKVRSGDRVIIERWGGDIDLEGVVKRVEPWAFTKVSALGVEEQRVRAIITFADTSETRPALGDGYRVHVRIIVDEAQSVLQIPSNVLFSDDETDQVFVVDRGRARLRDVIVGLDNGLHAEIQDGLEAGETLILYPGEAIMHGTRVKSR